MAAEHVRGFERFRTGKMDDGLPIWFVDLRRAPEQTRVAFWKTSVQVMEVPELLPPADGLLYRVHGKSFGFVHTMRHILNDVGHAIFFEKSEYEYFDPLGEESTPRNYMPRNAPVGMTQEEVLERRQMLKTIAREQAERDEEPE